MSSFCSTHKNEALLYFYFFFFFLKRQPWSRFWLSEVFTVMSYYLSNQQQDLAQADNRLGLLTLAPLLLQQPLHPNRSRLNTVELIVLNSWYDRRMCCFRGDQRRSVQGRMSFDLQDHLTDWRLEWFYTPLCHILKFTSRSVWGLLIIVDWCVMCILLKCFDWI